jgi:hypothetical protein
VARQFSHRRLAGGAGIAAILAAAGVLVALVSGDLRAGSRLLQATGNAPSPAASPRTSAADPSGPPVRITVTGKLTGQTIRPGFLGLSFEFPAVRAYTGSDAARINPVLVALIRNLTPDQRPVIRIGGDSTDLSYVPAPGIRPPRYVGYQLTPSWMATTSALAHQLDARMIMGLNLVANEPALAAAEAGDFVRYLGPGSIDALEIGNEPNVYGKLTKVPTAQGASVKARRRGYGYPAYRRQFAAVAAASPRLPLAGPALTTGPNPGRGSWIDTIPDFLKSQRVAIMTVHRYPLRNCYVPPSSPQYPTVANLLSDYSTTGLAASLRGWIRLAHAQHRPLRLDELNSVACRGKAGVSDTFASSLWVLDALFALARAGVDGVNIHTLPATAYEPFAFSDSGGRWSAQVRPLYYGLEMFAQAAPPGARLLKLEGPGPGTGLSEWATRAPGGQRRVVLINKSETQARTVMLALAHGPGARAAVERLQAPSVYSRTGVTLGAGSYGTRTYTGQLPAPRTQSVAPSDRGYTISVPRGSAALVSLR